MLLVRIMVFSFESNCCLRIYLWPQLSKTYHMIDDDEPILERADGWVFGCFRLHVPSHETRLLRWMFWPISSLIVCWVVSFCLQYGDWVELRKKPYNQGIEEETQERRQEYETSNQDGAVWKLFQFLQSATSSRWWWHRSGYGMDVLHVLRESLKTSMICPSDRSRPGILALWAELPLFLLRPNSCKIWWSRTMTSGKHKIHIEVVAVIVPPTAGLRKYCVFIVQVNHSGQDHSTRCILVYGRGIARRGLWRWWWWWRRRWWGWRWWRRWWGWWWWRGWWGWGRRPRPKGSLREILFAGSFGFLLLFWVQLQ